MISDFIEDAAHGRRRTITIAGLTLPWPFPITYWLHSSSAIIFGAPVFTEKASWFVRVTYGLFRRLSDAKYWLYYRFHPAHQYHMINTGLPYGFHEHNRRLLYGAIACLIEYVEECDASGTHNPGDEALAILHWWHVLRPADQAQHAQWMHELYSGHELETKPIEGTNMCEIVMPEQSDEEKAKQQAMWDLEKEMRDDEQAYLHRLIDIRPSMWT